MSSFALNRDEALSALAELDRRLADQGAVGELCLFGGAVMVLAFNARLATRDIDALFQPSETVRKLAAAIAEERGWPSGWLNDGVKGFVSARHEVTTGNLPQFPSLRLTMPTPEYLLAMKCLASRIGIAAGEADDTADIVFLIRHLKLSGPDQAMEIVERYFPPAQIPVKARFLVESLFSEGRI